jgi:hypothetical protein
MKTITWEFDDACDRTAISVSSTVIEETVSTTRRR